jgi:hypothetical protein
MTRRKKITIGNRKINETALLGELKSVQQKIKTWAESRNLWHDASFLTPYIFHDEPPKRDQVLLLIMEQSLDWTLGSGGPEAAQLGREWAALLEELCFRFELENHHTISLYPEADVPMDEFLSMNRWQWLQHLAETKMVDLHGELFEHYRNSVERLAHLRDEVVYKATDITAEECRNLMTDCLKFATKYSLEVYGCDYLD